MNPAFALAIVALIGILGLASWGRRSSATGRLGLKLALGLGLGLALVTLTLIAPRLVWLGIGAVGVFVTLRRLAASASANPFGQSSRARTSTVETDYLSASLDHESGDMDAEVTQGPMSGRRLSQLSVEELHALLAFLRSADAQSARIVETFLEREYGEGRGDAGENAHSADDRSSRADGEAMTERRALEVLGLLTGASRAEVIEAHRRLINRLHPDRGGSSYLAAEINRAKDCLLKSR